jgi:hypothetical protein
MISEFKMTILLTLTHTYGIVSRSAMRGFRVQSLGGLHNLQWRFRLHLLPMVLSSEEGES